MKSLLIILNVLICTFYLIAQQPNLQYAKQATKVTSSQDQLTFDTEIINLGKTEAAYSYLGYYLSADQEITTDDIYLGYDYVTALSFKEKSKEAFSINLKNRTDIPDGTYYIGLIIDYTQRIIESNENDNTYLWNEEKIVINNTPNLVLVTNESTAISNGLTIAYDVVVKNVGGMEAAYSYLGYYLSTDQAITTNDIYLGYDYVTSLASGEISAEEFSTNLENRTDIPNGEYYVGAIVDYTYRVDESDENDNITLWSDEKVRIGTKPDLSFSMENILLSYNDDNDEITINCVVQNQGAGDASYSYLGYYLSTDLTITTDDIYLGYDYVTALSSNEKSTESFRFNLESLALTPGEYYIGIIIDYTNRVDENNEDNNTYFNHNGFIIQEEWNECACTNYEATSFCDDLQSYNLGVIGPQSDCWTTFSGNEGGNEEGIIRENSVGNKYMRITKANGTKQDAVLKLGDRTSGKYELKFKMFIPEGKKGYYGIMHQFIAGGNDNDQFAQDVVFEGYGTAKIRVNNDWYTFSYEPNSWIEIYQEFDLDNNVTRLFIQGDLFAYWPFSLYNRGTNGLMKLSAVNFYAYDNDYRFYMDDFEFSMVDEFNSPSNFTTTPAQHLSEKLKYEPIKAFTYQTIPNQNNQSEPNSNQTSSHELINYPNPTRDFFTSQLFLEVESEVTLELRDGTGRVLETIQITGQGKVQYNFNLSVQPTGMYYVCARVADDIMTAPVVKID